MTREELHRLVDALPDDRIQSLANHLAKDFEALVIEALGTPGAPRPGEGDLDEELERTPGLATHLGRALERLKRGELGPTHAQVQRRFRD